MMKGGGTDPLLMWIKSSLGPTTLVGESPALALAHFFSLEKLKAYLNFAYFRQWRQKNTKVDKRNIYLCIDIYDFIGGVNEDRHYM